MSKVKQLLEIGETLKVKGETFEVLTVSVRSESEDSTPTSYQYELILKSEADAIRDKNERTQAAERKAAAERAEAEAKRIAELEAGSQTES